MPLVKFDGPEGPEAHAVPIGPNSLLRLTLGEVRHIQRVADLTAMEVRDRVFAADPDPVAVTALVQVLWKRQGRAVKFDDVDFDMSTLVFDLLPEEEADDDEEPAAPADPGPVVEDPTETPSGGVTGED